MVLKRGLTFCLVVLGAYASAQAQAPSDSIQVTLDQALEIALSDNPTIQVAENTIALKKFSRKETRAGLLPTISATAALQHNLILQKMKVDFSPEPIALGQKNTVNGTFAASMPLIAPQLWKTMQLSNQDIALAVEQARSSEIDLVKQVKTSYFTYMLAKDALKSLQAGYDNAALNAKIVTDKFNQGLVSEYDKLVADVQLRNQVPQLANGKNALRVSELQIKALLGVDLETPFIFLGELRDYENEMFGDLIKLQSNTSLENNTTVKQFDIQSKQLELARKVNQLGYVPTLAASINFGWQGMDNTLKLLDYQWFKGSTVGVSLTIPIFDGGQKYFKNKQNKTNIINLDLQRDNTIRNLQVSVANSIDKIETSVEQVQSNKESVTQAEKAFVISQKRYEVGSGTLLEMNSSETQLTQARLQYAQSIYDYLAARAELEATLGTSVQEEQSTQTEEK